MFEHRRLRARLTWHELAEDWMWEVFPNWTPKPQLKKWRQSLPRFGLQVQSVPLQNHQSPHCPLRFSLGHQLTELLPDKRLPKVLVSYMKLPASHISSYINDDSCFSQCISMLCWDMLSILPRLQIGGVSFCFFCCFSSFFCSFFRFCSSNCLCCSAISCSLSSLARRSMIKPSQVGPCRS